MASVREETRRIDDCCHQIEECCQRLGNSPDVRRIREETVRIRQCCDQIQTEPSVRA